MTIHKLDCILLQFVFKGNCACLGGLNIFMELNNMYGIHLTKNCGNEIIGNTSFETANPTKTFQITLLITLPNGKLIVIIIHNTMRKIIKPSILFVILFLWQISSFAQVVFNELMIDPSPAISLPEYEFIELYNAGSDSINLSNWIIKGGTCDCVLPSFSLASHSFVLIASTSAKAKLDSYGKVLYCPCFPSLNNDGKTLWLIDDKGKMQDYVYYDISWYNSESKAQGGWTLERKDVSLTCSCPENWLASTNILGGTPGKENSVIEEISFPKSSITKVGNITDSSITISFSSQMDSSSVLNTSNFVVDHGIGNPISIYSNFPKYDVVTFVLSSVIHSNETYNVQCSSSILNCNKSPIDAISKRFAFADSIKSNDIVINEILFNPPIDGVDFVELYNRSLKVLDLKDISIANKNITTNNIGTLSILSPQGQLLFPNEYLIITSNTKILKEKYNLPTDISIIELSTFPSFPDDEGIVSIANRAGTIIDEFHYKSSMQSEQLTSDEGVSLERINPNIPANQNSNWHSAAWSCGFATPGKENSQYLDSQSGEKLLTISPSTISPNNDGIDDIAALSFENSEEGFTSTILIFNQNGIPVRKLVANKTMATAGNVFWDGLDDSGNVVPIGLYIIYCSTYNLKGTKKECKTTCIVASK